MKESIYNILTQTFSTVRRIRKTRLNNSIAQSRKSNAKAQKL